MKIKLIITLLIILVFFIISDNKKEKFFQTQNSQLITQEISPNTLFNFVSPNELNLAIFNGKFYLTNQPGYNFTGSFENTNGLLKLVSTDSTMDLTLKYNQTNPPNSKIVPINKQEIDENTSKNIFSGNTNQQQLNNLFSLQNNKIYFDPINKLIKSNDSQGNIIYLQNSIPGNPLNWDYNIFNGITLNYMIIKQ